VSPAAVAPFAVLGLAIVAACRDGARPAVFVTAAVAAAAALLAGVVTPLGLAVLVALAALLVGGARPTTPTATRVVMHVVAAAIVVALQLHAVPGFHNPVALDAVRFTPDAAPYTQYLNFDKGAAGLLLLALVARRAGSWRERMRAIATGAAFALVFAVPVLAIGYGVGWFAFAPKVPDQTLAWMAINVLFVCVAEDTFCRGFVQQPLTDALVRWRARRAAMLVPALVSAAVFGLAHAGGGASYVLLAAVAGTGYALAYAKTGCIEASVTAHFVTNSLHFLLFTYPRLA
jgi:membrane protease YdiL (CAAX protease family)